VARRSFESFCVPEHIALYPGATVYGSAIPPSAPIADPGEQLEQLSAFAERLGLG
jgi:hypothetical protein